MSYQYFVKKLEILCEPIIMIRKPLVEPIERINIVLYPQNQNNNDIHATLGVLVCVLIFIRLTVTVLGLTFLIVFIFSLLSYNTFSEFTIAHLLKCIILYTFV